MQIFGDVHVKLVFSKILGHEAPEAAFDWTNPVELTPDAAEYIEIEFEKGVPVALNGEKLPLVQLIETLNTAWRQTWRWAY